MAFLLDTNCWIHVLKHTDSPIRSRLNALGPHDVVTCSVVRAELLHGAEKYGNRERRIAIVRQSLSPFNSLPFDDGATGIFAHVRHELETIGLSIGPYDLQIAAICLQHGHTLVTNNVHEFSRVDGLVIEDWLQAP
jgi:tRNA(fMet)-specific endonuclease VapC